MVPIRIRTERPGYVLNSLLMPTPTRRPARRAR